jgi:hypothetical protein
MKARIGTAQRTILNPYDHGVLECVAMLPSSSLRWTSTPIFWHSSTGRLGCAVAAHVDPFSINRCDGRGYQRVQREAYDLPRESYPPRCSGDCRYRGESASSLSWFRHSLVPTPLHRFIASRTMPSECASHALSDAHESRPHQRVLHVASWSGGRRDSTRTVDDDSRMNRATVCIVHMLTTDALSRLCHRALAPLVSPPARHVAMSCSVCACTRFSQHVWRKNKCNECFHAVNLHQGVTVRRQGDHKGCMRADGMRPEN